MPFEHELWNKSFYRHDILFLTLFCAFLEWYSTRIPLALTAWSKTVSTSRRAFEPINTNSRASIFYFTWLGNKRSGQQNKLQKLDSELFNVGFDSFSCSVLMCRPLLWRNVDKDKLWVVGYYVYNYHLFWYNTIGWFINQPAKHFLLINIVIYANTTGVGWSFLFLSLRVLQYKIR